MENEVENMENNNQMVLILTPMSEEGKMRIQTFSSLQKSPTKSRKLL